MYVFCIIYVFRSTKIIIYVDQTHVDTYLFSKTFFTINIRDLYLYYKLY